MRHSCFKIGIHQNIHIFVTFSLLWSNPDRVTFFFHYVYIREEKT